MEQLKSLLIPIRRIVNRIRYTPRRLPSLARRLMGSGMGPWALVDIIWRAASISRQYQFYRKHNAMTPDAIASHRREAEALAYKPTISILMPVYNSDAGWLQAAIESVRQQIYPHWELCIADDASTEPHIRVILDHYQQLDHRIKVIWRVRQGHISACSNSALSLATGEYVALLDHDDEISVDALYQVVRLVNAHPDADLVYSDEDKLDTNGQHTEPFFKPDWSPVLLTNINYITHFAVLRRQLVITIGGFRDDYVGSQDHDLFLRFTAHTDHVYHIPKVLYSWRKALTSAALISDVKSYAYDASVRAVTDAVSKRNADATIQPGVYPPFIRVRYPVAEQTSVSLVVLVESQNDFATVNRIINITTGCRLQVVAVTNNEKLKDLNERNVFRLLYTEALLPGQQFQAGAENVTSDYLLFAKHPFKPLGTDWLTALLEYAQLPHVGCVGGKVLSRRHFVMTAGIATGVKGSAANIGVGIADVPQLMFYLNLKDAIREVSAVSAKCMLVRASTFWQLGGFDAEFAATLYDADFCLRARKSALSTIFTPYAQVMLSRRSELATPASELSAFRHRWASSIDHDPYYSDHFTRQHQDMRLRDVTEFANPP